MRKRRRKRLFSPPSESMKYSNGSPVSQQGNDLAMMSNLAIESCLSLPLLELIGGLYFTVTKEMNAGS